MSEIKEKKIFLDSIFAENDADSSPITSKKDQKINKNTKSTLFSRGRKTEFFYTEDSKLYITPREQKMMENGIEINTREVRFDGLSTKIIRNYRQFKPKENDFLYKNLLDKYEEIRENFADFPQNFVSRKELALCKAYNIHPYNRDIVFFLLDNHGK